MVVTMSHGGYMKAQPVAEYRAQRRGGRGKQATGTKDDDFIDRLFIANTHDYILCFSNRGRVYWLKVYNVPQGGRVSRGKPIVNLVPLLEHEKITAILPVKEFVQDRFVFMATAKGTVKKTPLSEFSRPRPSGIIAVDLDDGDFLVGAALTDGKHDVMLFSSGGKAVRFEETDVRPDGAQRARRARHDARQAARRVISMLVAEDEQQSVLTATENGYGKRTPIVEYTRHGRGTKGMIAIQQTARNGKVVAAALVRPDDEVMLISTGGVLIRTKVSSIREMSRSTQGVTLINLGEGEKLAGLERVRRDRGRRRRGAGMRSRAIVYRADRGAGDLTGVSTAKLKRCRSSHSDQEISVAARRSTRSIARSCASLNERAAHAQAIGKLKGDDVAYRPEREAQVLRAIQAQNRGPLLRWRGDRRLPPDHVRLPRARAASCGSPISVRPGTFSHAAVTRHFGDLVDAEPCASIDEVFRAAESGQTDYAVVPVENSTEGAVGRTLDLMCQTPLDDRRRDQAAHRSRTCWSSATHRFAGGDQASIRTRSRSSQCVQWLARHLPSAARIPVASNAEAARWPRPSQEPRQLPAKPPRRSTASTSCASHIEDEPNNTTRFWVLGQAQRGAVGPRRDVAGDVGAQSSGRGACAARAAREARREHEPPRIETGAHRAVGIPVLRRSRGSPQDAPVAAALAELRERAPFLKLLGLVSRLGVVT